jgi:prepilin-type N-terminal cleavage/methylation domain-containing protein
MKKGFTLLELTIVVIIIGILVSIAIPKMLSSAERARSSEGLGIIGAIRSAQVRYYASWNAYTATCGQTATALDTGYTSPAYFGAVTCTPGTPDAAITRTGNGYTLRINFDTGVVSCSSGASITCAQAGFQTAP